MSELPSHVLANRQAWTRMSVDFAEPGRRSWSTDRITWGIWEVPEGDLRALGDLSQWRGKDVVELGCGTAYFSAWLARLGARPVGVDITPAQLENARAYQREFGIEFPLHEENAEATSLPSQSFDLAISEYGASIWCDPARWIPEAARLLRPGGTLVFLRNSALSVLCTGDEGPAQTSLMRDWSQMGRIEWDGSVEFHLPPSDMIRLLRESGFEVEALIDVFPPPDAKPVRYDYITLDWSRRWPCEEIWRARRR